MSKVDIEPTKTEHKENAANAEETTKDVSGLTLLAAPPPPPIQRAVSRLQKAPAAGSKQKLVSSYQKFGNSYVARVIASYKSSAATINRCACEAETEEKKQEQVAPSAPAPKTEASNEPLCEQCNAAQEEAATSIPLLRSVEAPTADPALIQRDCSDGSCGTPEPTAAQEAPVAAATQEAPVVKPTEPAPIVTQTPTEQPVNQQPAITQTPDPNNAANQAATEPAVTQPAVTQEAITPTPSANSGGGEYDCTFPPLESLLTAPSIQPAPTPPVDYALPKEELLKINCGTSEVKNPKPGFDLFGGATDIALNLANLALPVADTLAGSVAPDSQSLQLKPPTKPNTGENISAEFLAFIAEMTAKHATTLNAINMQKKTVLDSIPQQQTELNQAFTQDNASLNDSYNNTVRLVQQQFILAQAATKIGAQLAMKILINDTATRIAEVDPIINSNSAAMQRSAEGAVAKLATLAKRNNQAIDEKAKAKSLDAAAYEQTLLKEFGNYDSVKDSSTGVASWLHSHCTATSAKFLKIYPDAKPDLCTAYQQSAQSLRNEAIKNAQQMYASKGKSKQLLADLRDQSLKLLVSSTCDSQTRLKQAEAKTLTELDKARKTSQRNLRSKYTMAGYKLVQIKSGALQFLNQEKITLTTNVNSYIDFTIKNLGGLSGSLGLKYKKLALDKAAPLDSYTEEIGGANGIGQQTKKLFEKSVQETRTESSNLLAGIKAQNLGVAARLAVDLTSATLKISIEFMQLAKATNDLLVSRNTTLGVMAQAAVQDAIRQFDKAYADKIEKNSPRMIEEFILQNILKPYSDFTTDTRNELKHLAYSPPDNARIILATHLATAAVFSIVSGIINFIIMGIVFAAFAAFVVWLGVPAALVGAVLLVYGLFSLFQTLEADIATFHDPSSTPTEKAAVLGDIAFQIGSFFLPSPELNIKGSFGKFEGIQFKWADPMVKLSTITEGITTLTKLVRDQGRLSELYAGLDGSEPRLNRLIKILEQENLIDYYIYGKENQIKLLLDITIENTKLINELYERPVLLQSVGDIVKFDNFLLQSKLRQFFEFKGVDDAVYSWLAWQDSFNAGKAGQKPIIGSLKPGENSPNSTAIHYGKEGYEVLDVDKKGWKWSPALNDAWLQGFVDAGVTEIYLVTYPQGPTLFNPNTTGQAYVNALIREIGTPTVFGREYGTLVGEGYNFKRFEYTPELGIIYVLGK